MLLKHNYLMEISHEKSVLKNQQIEVVMSSFPRNITREIKVLKYTTCL